MHAKFKAKLNEDFAFYFKFTGKPTINIKWWQDGNLTLTSLEQLKDAFKK